MNEWLRARRRAKQLMIVGAVLVAIGILSMVLGLSMGAHMMITISIPK